MLLTQEEVNNLPDRTEIIVTWTGGNGPYKYILRQTNIGPYIEDPFWRNPMWKNGKLDFVGRERFHTRISLAISEYNEGQIISWRRTK